MDYDKTFVGDYLRETYGGNSGETFAVQTFIKVMFLENDGGNYILIPRRHWKIHTTFLQPILFRNVSTLRQLSFRVYPFTVVERFKILFDQMRTKFEEPRDRERAVYYYL